IKIVLDDYVNRTPGSFVEEKDYSLVWHYRKVETGLGEVRARELSSHLKYITNSQNLQVMEGDKVIEIKNSEVNKGKGAKRILKNYNPDFVLACGDDRTDEDTFLALPEGAHSIKIGAGASAAKYSVSDFTKIRTLLFELTKM
ncbi:MAG: trehalose-phosphatase, partial [Cyclobacteriaceae bacterium]